MTWYRIINPDGLRPELGEIIRSRNITHILGNGRYFVKVSDRTMTYLEMVLPVEVHINYINDSHTQLAVEQLYLDMNAPRAGVNS